MQRKKEIVAEYDTAGLIRLNKYLSDAGVCSRRQADKLIEEGKVTVDQIPAVTGMRISRDQEVRVEGRKVTVEDEFILLACNKPRGIECTTAETEGNIVDFIQYPKRIYPIGRLDKESTGLLLLTNNGQLMDDILRGSNYHEKEYIVHVNKPITDSVLQAMAQGVPILDTITRPCKIRRMGKDCFYITLTQGLNRQIRRMCEYFDYRVTSLKRIRIMNIELGSLPVGKWRELTPSEIKTLKNLAQNKGEAE